MKKSLLALAVLGAFAGVASAQSSVTIYGLADAGIAVVTGGTKGRELKLENGGRYATSFLGFRGTEDLGDGLSAVFKLEGSVDIPTGGGALFDRESWVGLKGNFGTVTAGYHYTPFWDAAASLDPLGTGLGGRSTNLVGTSGFRVKNSVRYSLPAMGGFTANVAYGFGEVAGNTSAGRSIGFNAGYANGPLMTVLAYHNLHDVATGLTSADVAENALLGGTYDFGVAKAHLAYGINKTRDAANLTTVKSRDLLVGVTVPFGARSTVMASYIVKKDKLASKDADQIALAYTYDMSKRTQLYTGIARIHNKNGAAYITQDATAPTPVEAAAGIVGGNREFIAGIRHTF